MCVCVCVRFSMLGVCWESTGFLSSYVCEDPPAAGSAAPGGCGQVTVMGSAAPASPPASPPLLYVSSATSSELHQRRPEGETRTDEETGAGVKRVAAVGEP